jgi:hypothetical protein
MKIIQLQQTVPAKAKSDYDYIMHYRKEKNICNREYKKSCEMVFQHEYVLLAPNMFISKGT